MRQSLSLLLMILSLTATLTAQVPRLISYQGILTDAGGNLLPDGLHTIRVKLFDAPTGGNELFAETQSVTVKRGVFNINLGEASGGLPASLSFDRAYFLAITVNGSTELLPRTPLTTSPYTFNALHASVADSAIATAPTSPAGPAGGDLSGSYPNPRVAAIQGRAVSSSSPSNGNVLKFNGSSWAPSADDAGPWATSGTNINSTNSGNVGIGTASPATKLQVVGTTRTSTLQITDGAASGRMLVSNGSGTALWTTDVKIVGGDVGIGDTTPKAKLHVTAGSSGFDPTFIRSFILEEDGHLTMSLRGPTGMEQSILFERPVGDTGARISSQADGDLRIGRFRFSDNGSASSSFHLFLDVQTGNFGVGRDPVTNDLEVEGTASKVTAGDWLANSDSRIKTDVVDIGESFKTLLRLRPVAFRYTEEWRRRHPSIEDRVYYNFIAQEYRQVFPHAVQSSGEFLDGDAEPILQIDTYDAQIVTIKAVQELIEENRQLRGRVDRVEGELKELRELVRQMSRASGATIKE